MVTQYTEQIQHIAMNYYAVDNKQNFNFAWEAEKTFINSAMDVQELVWLTVITALCSPCVELTKLIRV